MHQQRDVEHHDAGPFWPLRFDRRPVLEHFHDPGTHPRMDDGLESREPVVVRGGVAKDKACQGPTIDRAVRSQGFRAEERGDLAGEFALDQDIVGDSVGIDDPSPARGHQAGDRGLSGADAADEPDQDLILPVRRSLRCLQRDDSRPSRR